MKIAAACCKRVQDPASKVMLNLVIPSAAQPAGAAGLLKTLSSHPSVKQRTKHSTLDARRNKPLQSSEIGQSPAGIVPREPRQIPSGQLVSHPLILPARRRLFKCLRKPLLQPLLDLGIDGSGPWPWASIAEISVSPGCAQPPVLEEGIGVGQDSACSRGIPRTPPKSTIHKGRR